MRRRRGPGTPPTRRRRRKGAPEDGEKRRWRLAARIPAPPDRAPTMISTAIGSTTIITTMKTTITPRRKRGKNITGTPPSKLEKWKRMYSILHYLSPFSSLLRFFYRNRKFQKNKNKNPRILGYTFIT